MKQLGAQERSQTRHAFDKVDGLWWNSAKRVPDKFLVLTRNYDVTDSRYPFLPTQAIPSLGLKLSLPSEYAGFVLSDLAQFRLAPTTNMAQLPVPETYWTVSDFEALAEKAKIEDQKQQTLLLSE